MSDTWGSDVRISMPKVPKEDVVIPMGGFGFTLGGLRPDISESDIEDMSHPVYVPWRGDDYGAE